MTSLLPEPSFRFTLRPGAEAVEPPEHRGLARDEVRLLVARPTAIGHHRFHDLPDLLEPGDLVVVNTSRTVPAAVDARRDDGPAVRVHVSTQLDDGDWVVELRLPDASGPDLGGVRGTQLALPGDLVLTLVDSWPLRHVQRPRLWRARPSRPVRAVDHLAAHGHPVTYGYLRSRPPIEDYQTIFACEPGSAEMPSAGRPFTPELVLRLMTRGIGVAPIVLHAGVSSPERNEPPLPEWFRVPAATARQVESTRAAGGRVVAVGTTVTRALESAVDDDGGMRAATGWTSVVLSPQRPARIVTGLVSGLHAPEASHLLLLEAVAGERLVRLAYEQAVQERYLWHEFGDSSLFLP